MVCEREGQAWWTESGGLMVFEDEGQACSLGQVVSWFVRGKVRPGGLGQVVSWFVRVKVRPVHWVRWCDSL